MTPCDGDLSSNNKSLPGMPSPLAAFSPALNLNRGLAPITEKKKSNPPSLAPLALSDFYLTTLRPTALTTRQCPPDNYNSTSKRLEVFALTVFGEERLHDVFVTASYRDKLDISSYSSILLLSLVHYNTHTQRLRTRSNRFLYILRTTRHRILLFVIWEERDKAQWMLNMTG